jgi:hypothetical protein
VNKQFCQPGGATLIRDYSELRASIDEGEMERFFVARRAFGGELNNQGRTCGEAQDVRISCKSPFAVRF